MIATVSASAFIVITLCLLSGILGLIIKKKCGKSQSEIGVHFPSTIPNEKNYSSNHKGKHTEYEDNPAYVQSKENEKFDIQESYEEFPGYEKCPVYEEVGLGPPDIWGYD